MSYIFFILILLICFFGAIKKPGFILSYLFFFQNLNKMIFNQIGFDEFRYSTSLLIILIISVLHLKRLDFPVIFSFLIQNNIFKGYMILVFYIIIYALLLGTSYELTYLQLFLFPGSVLFLLSSYTFTYNRFYKEFFIGIIFFSILTAVTLIFFKGFDALSDRTFSTDISNISAITQGRMAGLLTIFSMSILILPNKLSSFLKSVSYFITSFSLIWLTMTGTRGALISLFFTLIFYFIFTTRKKNAYKYLIFGSIIVFPILFYFGISDSLLFTRFLETRDFNEIERVYRFKVFLKELPEYFVFGTGPGGWSKQIWGGEYRYPHNIFMEFFIEFGLLGLISFLLIYISSYRIAIIVLKNKFNNSYLTPIVLGWVYLSIIVMFSGGFVGGNDYFFTFSGIMIGIASFLKVENLNNNK